MKPVNPEELSALIDGELSSERAAEVRKAIAESAALRQEFEELTAFNGQLKACASVTAFAPQVSLQRGLIRGRARFFGLVAALLVLRWLVKVAPPIPNIGLEVVVLCIVVGWAVRYLLRWSDEDLHDFTRSAALKVAVG